MARLETWPLYLVSISRLTTHWTSMMYDIFLHDCILANGLSSSSNMNCPYVINIARLSWNAHKFISLSNWSSLYSISKYMGFIMWKFWKQNSNNSQHSRKLINLTIKLKTPEKSFNESKIYIFFTNQVLVKDNTLEIFFQTALFFWISQRKCSKWSS